MCHSTYPVEVIEKWSLCNVGSFCEQESNQLFTVIYMDHVEHMWNITVYPLYIPQSQISKQIWVKNFLPDI